jgi:hypothetical protein
VALLGRLWHEGDLPGHPRDRGDLVYADADGPTPTATDTSDSSAARCMRAAGKTGGWLGLAYLREEERDGERGAEVVSIGLATGSWPRRRASVGRHRGRRVPGEGRARSRIALERVG